MKKQEKLEREYEPISSESDINVSVENMRFAVTEGPGIVEDLGGMATEDIMKSMERIEREVRVATPVASEGNADELVVGTLDILHRRIRTAEESREGFGMKLNQLNDDIKRMIAERQHMRNEIVQCDRVIDSLQLSILGLDIT